MIGKILIILIVLAAIAYQDFKHRAVSWYWFVLLPVSILIIRNAELETTFTQFVINCGFLFMNAVMVFSYFSLKHRRAINPLNTYIGLGDVLFFIGIGFLFSPLNFVLFFTLSLFIALLFYAFVVKIPKEDSKQIPLAGFLSIILGVLLIANLIIEYNLGSDILILEKLVANGIY